MYGTQLITDTTPTRCFHFLVGNINLDWSQLIWVGLLILVFEICLYTVVRLKNIYIPPRFLIATMVVSAIILAELLPYLFLQLHASTCN